MHILEEWRLRDIEYKSDRAVQRLYEIDAIRSDVGGLEHSVRELRAEVAGLRNELQAAQDRIQTLEDLKEQSDAD